MPKNNGNRVSGNVNLGLNSLTLDDVIMRAALNDGLDEQRVKEDYEKGIKEQYGRKVFGGKVIINRTDYNSPLIRTREGKYDIDEHRKDKIEASIDTITELSVYGAKIVIITHQGTVGDTDCISLVPHHKVLEQSLGKDVIFNSAYWYGGTTQGIIRDMNWGDAFLLDNIRKLSDDGGDGKTIRGPLEFISLPDSYMSTLGNLADFFVNDAFPTFHRWQGSIVGFPYLLNIAGRSTEKEINTNKAVKTAIRPPYTMLLGGVKPTEYFDLIESSLEDGLVDKVLAAGVLGVIGVLGIIGGGQKNYLGKNTEQFLRSKNIYSELNRMIGLAKRYRDTFILPPDFRVDIDGDVVTMTPEEIQKHPDKDRMNLYGIGPKTVDLFDKILKDSKTIFIKGPLVYYQDNDERFLPQAKQIYGMCVQLTHQGVTTILSGGHTNALANEFGFSSDVDFTYATLAGGAAARYHGGTLLPGLLMLNTSYNAFNGLDLKSGLENYKVLVELVAPRIPKNLMPK